MKEEIQALKESLTDIQSSVIWALKEIDGLVEPDKCPNCGSDDKAVHKKRRITYEDGSHERIKYCPDSWHDEPEAPTHEEIIAKWWKHNNAWYKVTAFNSFEERSGYGLKERRRYWIGSCWKDYDWFTVLQSADTPPEGEKT